jgi:hypothetical protein
LRIWVTTEFAGSSETLCTYQNTWHLIP